MRWIFLAVAGLAILVLACIGWQQVLVGLAGVVAFRLVWSALTFE